MKTLKFWEDQLPNGQVTESSSRLVFLIGWAFLFGLIAVEVTFSKLYGKSIDYALIAMVAGFVTGQKMYQKAVEAKDISQDTPQVQNEPKPCQP